MAEATLWAIFFGVVFGVWALSKLVEQLWWRTK